MADSGDTPHRAMPGIRARLRPNAPGRDPLLSILEVCSAVELLRGHAALHRSTEIGVQTNNFIEVESVQ